MDTHHSSCLCPACCIHWGALVHLRRLADLPIRDRGLEVPLMYEVGLLLVLLMP